MAQGVKELAAKPNNWSVILGTHIVEEENLGHKLSSKHHVNTFPCACPQFLLHHTNK